MKYKVILASDYELFEQFVNEAIREGWTLHGGVAMSESNYHSTDAQGYEKDNFNRTFSQAMVKGNQ